MENRRMASDPLWERDMRGLEHPEQSLLLAFIRGECPEHEKRIQRASPPVRRRAIKPLSGCHKVARR